MSLQMLQTLKAQKNYKLHTNKFNNLERGFPGGSVVKNSPVNAGDKGSIPGPGRAHRPQST